MDLNDCRNRRSSRVHQFSSCRCIHDVVDIEPISCAATFEIEALLRVLHEIDMEVRAARLPLVDFVQVAGSCA